MFDPYEAWLGIEGSEQALSYYRLLGIPTKEDDPDVISEAARRQMKRLRKHEDGPEAETCERLINEIKKARATLIDPERRKKYDALLRRSADEQDDETVKPRNKRRKSEDQDDDRPSRSSNAKERSRSSDRSLFWPVVGSLVVLLLVGGGVTAWVLTHKEEKARHDPPAEPLVASAPDPAPALPATKLESTTKVDPPVQPSPAPTPIAPTPTSPPAIVRKDPPPPPPVVVKQPEPAKLPVPDAAAQAQAEKALRETYKVEYAKQKPEDKMLLSAKFLQPGRENRQDPAAWYVLLREARDLALQAERPRVALEAIDEIDKWFVVDRNKLVFEALEKPDTAHSEVAAVEVIGAALGRINRVLDDDRYDVAQRLIDLADATAQKSKWGKKLLARIEAKRQTLQSYLSDFQAAQSASALLKTQPDDAGAHYAVGKYLCYFHGRWPEGLPHLARGSNPVVASLAQQDLAQPAEAEAQVAVGDGWWAVMGTNHDRKDGNVEARAVSWYQRAEPKAQGEAQKRAAKRTHEARERAWAQDAHPPRGSFYGRTIADRVLLLRDGGGTMSSEEAVERGLQWLASHQARSGRWGTDDFQTAAKCSCRDHADNRFDVGGTALGLMPFLGAGEMYASSKYAPNVVKGLKYLLSKQKKPAGNFSDSAYENALATLVVCEAYGQTELHDPRLRDSAQAALNYIMRIQHSGGGWRYSPGQPGDTSVTGWHFSALKAGYYAGLKVAPEAFAGVARFLGTVADPGGQGYGYETPGAGRTTTATGLVIREFLGWGPDHPNVKQNVEFLSLPQNRVTSDKPAIYYLFYATQAMHHFGGKPWQDWNNNVRDLLVHLQDEGKEKGFEHQRGSWAPFGDDWSKQGGRLMYTSLALLTLEVYYYHVPLYGHGAAVLQE